MTITHRRNRGFTLIELLVVIAIIALLLSILLPVLQSARNEGTKGVCISNLKTCMQGTIMYYEDYESTKWIPWYLLKQGDASSGVAGGLPSYYYTASDGLYADPVGTAPWTFGGSRAPSPNAASGTELGGASDYAVYPAQFRPLNKYIDPGAFEDEGDATSRGNTIKAYTCPSDRSYKLNVLGLEAELPNEAQENAKSAREAYGSSLTLNSRWLQGYGNGLNPPDRQPKKLPQVFGSWTDMNKAFGEMGRTLVGGQASQFIHWVEIGFYSAAQNAHQSLNLTAANNPRFGWHRKFSQWSAAFADGHTQHGYFDTRQVFGLGGTLWQPGVQVTLGFN